MKITKVFIRGQHVANQFHLATGQIVESNITNHFGKLFSNGQEDKIQQACAVMSLLNAGQKVPARYFPNVARVGPVFA